jgi:hypothetical protein
MTKNIFIFIGIFVCLSIGIATCNMFSDGTKTVKNEFKPSQLLKKYEYFKDLSGGIDKKDAEIQMYQAEIESMTITDKDDKFYFQQRKSELLGIISIRNQMCSEYNIAMSKFNYAFCNKGTLPQTNLEPLPREYKPYINNLKNSK